MEHPLSTEVFSEENHGTDFHEIEIWCMSRMSFFGGLGVLGCQWCFLNVPKWESTGNGENSGIPNTEFLWKQRKGFNFPRMWRLWWLCSNPFRPSPSPFSVRPFEILPESQWTVPSCWHVEVSSSENGGYPCSSSILDVRISMIKILAYHHLLKHPLYQWIPIGSMVLEYLPTFTLYLWPSYVGKYSSTMDPMGLVWGKHIQETHGAAHISLENPWYPVEIFP